MRKAFKVLLAGIACMALTACGAKEAAYIGNRSVQYDEAKKEYTVFFGFYHTDSQDSEPVKQEADISVRIVNDDGAEVYSDTMHVDENNYGEWTNNLWKSSKILGTVTVNSASIEKGTTENGILYVGATLPSGAGFEEEQLSVYGLPLMDVSIQAPDLPVSINNYKYDGTVETTATIDKLEFSYDYSCHLEYTITMTSNVNGDSSDDYFHVPYKIKDSSGIVVDSGTLFAGPMAVNDTIKNSTYISGVKLGENYTIEFSDYSW